MVPIKIVTYDNRKSLVAIKDILKDEEIFVDYTKDFELEQPHSKWSK